MPIRSFAIVALSCILQVSTLLAQSTNPVRVNISSTGQQSISSFSGTNSYLSTPGISADGRFVSFDSGSTDVTSVSSPGYHVFVRDIAAGTTELVSRTTLGAEVTGRGSVLSSDGRFVLFASSQIDSFTFSDQLYLRDRQAATTTLVSGAPASGEPNQSWLGSAFRVGAMSNDGRFVAFSSLASNLIVPNESNETTADLFIYDRVSGSTRRAVAVTPESGSLIYDFALSGDGNILAFATDDPGIVTGDVNASVDLFTMDLTSGAVKKAFTHPGSQGSFLSQLSLSGDGRYLAFVSTIPLDLRDTDGNSQIYVYDRVLEKTTLVSVGFANDSGNTSSSSCSISNDGQVIAFASAATNILPNSFNAQIYLRRWQTGETLRVSSTQTGEPGDGASSLVAMTPGANFASFLSFSSNLVADDTNNDADYFRANLDFCPTDPAKLTPGSCGCGASEIDANGNGVPDCAETLTPQTKLTLPPTVSVSGRTATLTLQKFAGIVLSKSRAQFMERASKGFKKLSIQYEITLMRVGASKRERIKRITKRNVETFKKLPPGQYSATYQAFGLKGTKNVIKTNSSPRATFEIQ